MKTTLTLIALAVVLPGGILILLGMLARHRHQQRIERMVHAERKQRLAHLSDSSIKPAIIEPNIL